VYLVVIEKSYSETQYSETYTVKYETVKYFENVESLERYLVEQRERRYGEDKIMKVFSATELKVGYKTCLELTQ